MFKLKLELVVHIHDPQNFGDCAMLPACEAHGHQLHRQTINLVWFPSAHFLVSGPQGHAMCQVLGKPFSSGKWCQMVFQWPVHVCTHTHTLTHKRIMFIFTYTGILRYAYIYYICNKTLPQRIRKLSFSVYSLQ